MPETNKPTPTLDELNKSYLEFCARNELDHTIPVDGQYDPTNSQEAWISRHLKLVAKRTMLDIAASDQVRASVEGDSDELGTIELEEGLAFYCDYDVAALSGMDAVQSGSIPSILQ